MAEFSIIRFDPKRIYGLDILRAVAILIVVFGHSGSMMSPAAENAILLFLPDGVSMFFILSGFLIGGILINEVEKKGASFKVILNFWFRRWLRTLPLYYFTLILLVVLSYLFLDNFNVRQILPFLFFCQNLFEFDIHFFLVSWSLSIEEWFYLFIPLSLFIAIRVLKVEARQAVFYLAICVIGFTVIFRFHRYQTYDISSAEAFARLFRNVVITRCDSLMFGVVGAWIQFYYKPVWVLHKKSLFVAGLGLHVTLKILSIFFLGNSAFFYCNFYFIIEALATLALIPFLATLKGGKGFVYKCITYISIISYSIYLIHAQVVQDWILQFNYLPYIDYGFLVSIKYVLFWVLTMGLSVVTYKYIEVPFMAIRKS